MEKSADLDVVEADDGDVLGHAQVVAMQRADGANSGEVIGGNNCGRSLFQCEEPLHGRASAVYAVVADLDQRLAAGEALAFERCKQCLTTGTRGSKLHGAADESNAGVSKRGDVLDRVVDA